MWLRVGWWIRSSWVRLSYDTRVWGTRVHLWDYLGRLNRRWSLGIGLMRRYWRSLRHDGKRMRAKIWWKIWLQGMIWRLEHLWWNVGS